MLRIINMYRQSSFKIFIPRQQFRSYCILLVAILFSSGVSAQRYLSWSHTYGSTTADNSSSVATDAAGNLYHTGSFTGTIDADPGAGVISFSSTGGSDACIAKLDANGNLLWALAITGSGSVDAKAITDAGGNLLISGTYSNGDIDLDPGAGVFNLTTSYQQQYVAKYDAAGNFIWGKSTEGSGGFMYFSDIALDGFGNIYTAGAFSGPVDFDPGAGVFTLTSSGINDEYVLKLDASGNFLWARRRPAASGYGISANSLAVDAAGNAYTTGSFGGTVDFDPGPGTFFLSNTIWGDAYLTKLNASGNFVYAFVISNSAGTDIGEALVLDASGSNIYVTGLFEQTTDLDPGAPLLQFTANGQNDAFVTKYNSTTGALAWARVLTGNVIEIPLQLTLDGNGNIYSAGYYFGQLDFDPGPGTYIINSDLSLNTYVSKLSSTGNFIWAGILYGTDINSPQEIIADNCGSICLAGSFEGTMDLEPGPSVKNITSAGDKDVYFIKLSQSFWTGAVSTNWHDPLNWACNTVPGIKGNAIIPTAVPRFPVLSADAEIKSIYVYPSASMQVQPGIRFTLNGPPD